MGKLCKLYLAIGLLCVVNMKVFAQDNFYFSQYSQVGPVSNPAMTGVDNFLDIKINYRSQWSGFEDGPQTNYFGINGYLEKETQTSYQQYSLRTSNPFYLDSLPKAEISLAERLRHGIGGHVIFDSQGPFEQIAGYVNYALHIPLGRRVKFSIGFSGSFTNQRIDVEKITLKNPDADETYQALLASDGRNTYFDLNPGIFLYGKRFYISYAAMRAYRTSISSNEQITDENQMDHVIMTGLRLPLGPKVSLLPSFRYNQNEQYGGQWDANLKTLINERTWLGISYRSTDALIFMGGVYINNLINLSYSYDYVTSDLNNYTNGSHEIVLGLMLFKKDTKAPYLW